LNKPKLNLKIMKKMYLMGVMLLGVCMTVPEAKAQTTDPKPDDKAKNGWIIKSYRVDELGYGYDIIDAATDRVIIRQTIIPGVQGIYRFETDEDAQKTGRMAAALMNKGIFPPTITFRNMDSLKVSLTKVKPIDFK
jgi:hypothetical protein